MTKNASWLKVHSGILCDKSQHTVIAELDVIDDNEVVMIRSMSHEFFLTEKIIFEDRDAAYNFIRNFSRDYARDFLTKLYYETVSK